MPNTNASMAAISMPNRTSNSSNESGMSDDNTGGSGGWRSSSPGTISNTHANPVDKLNQSQEVLSISLLACSCMSACRVVCVPRTYPPLLIPESGYGFWNSDKSAGRAWVSRDLLSSRFTGLRHELRGRETPGGTQLLGSACANENVWNW